VGLLSHSTAGIAAQAAGPPPILSDRVALPPPPPPACRFTTDPSPCRAVVCCAAWFEDTFNKDELLVRAYIAFGRSCVAS
jgi:hypothetical protein